MKIWSLLAFPLVILLMGANSTTSPGGSATLNNVLQGWSSVYFRFTLADGTGHIANSCPKARVIVHSNIANNADHDATFNVYECPSGAGDRSDGITGITRGATTVVTAPAHPFMVNHIVKFADIVGTVELNGLTGTITAADASTFTVNINSTTFTDYESGGTASLLVYTSSGCKLRSVRNSSDVVTANLTGDPATFLDRIPNMHNAPALSGAVIAFNVTVPAGQTAQADIRCEP